VAGYGTLALVCLGAAGFAFLLLASPLDAVRDRLIERINARIGGSVAATGPASLSLFPQATVTFRDVTVAASEDGQAAPIATVPSLEVEVGLWSLLLRQPQVGRLTLHRPSIALEVDAQGRRNWDIAGRRAPAPAAADNAGGSRGTSAPTKADARAGRPAPARRVAGGSVRIVDATVRYHDGRSGERHEIGALNLELSADGREGPVAVEGAFNWRGVDLRVSGTTSPLWNVLAGQPVELLLKVSGKPVEAGYQGKVTVKDGFASEGKLDLKAPSARALASWLGFARPAGNAPDALAVTARIASSEAQVKLASLEASLGEFTAAGSVTLDLEKRPRIEGKLQVSEVDLASLPGGRGKAADAPAALPAGSGVPAAPKPAPSEGAKGWSEEPIDTKLLGLADARLMLSAERLVYRGVKTGPAKLVLVSDAGVAKVAFEAAGVYGGKAKGTLQLDGTAASPAVAANLEFLGVAIEPLLKDASGVGWLGGRGNVALSISGRGISERQIVESLDGKVDLAVTDGTLNGIDIGKVMRAIERGRLPRLRPAPGERTPFSALAGGFDIAKGTAKSRKLDLVSTHLQVKGAGAVELARRRVDFRLDTKIRGGTNAPDAILKVGTIEVPVGIKGPLEAPAFSVMGQEALGDALKQIGKNLESRDVQDAIDGLLRGGGDKRKSRRELIEKLLKKE
jgi:AsmA protein